MDTPKSFKVDHLKLDRGIYISREDKVKDTSKVILTLDVRLCKPYVDVVLSNVQAHTLEHMMATVLRDVTSSYDYDWETVYVGPMGCMTGFYIVLVGEPDRYGINRYSRVFRVLEEMCTKLQMLDSVPATTEIECGNNTTLGTVKDVAQVIYTITNLVENISIRNRFDTYKYI